MEFKLKFNENIYETEENINILESIKGVRKEIEDSETYYMITFKDLKEMESFCLALEKKTYYNATCILSFNPTCIFIEMDV